MKKILYIWKGQFPFEIRIQKICESLVKFGYDVTVLCKWKNELCDRETINGVKVIRVGYNKGLKYFVPILYNPLWRNIINKVVSEFKPDLIINREFFLMNEVKSVVKDSIPIFMDMAENYPAAIANWGKYHNSFVKRFVFDRIKIFNILEKQAVQTADAIFTVCDENRDRLINVLNIPKDKVSVVHNTPDLNWFDNYPKGTRILPKIFAYHGYIAEERNLDKFLLGFNLAAESDGEIELEINGSGSTYSQLEQLQNTLAHKDRIHLNGNYLHSDLGELLIRCDVGIMPYLNDEFINTTISNKMFDYLAMGKPMITSLAKPMQRIINETQTGISIDCDSPQAIADALLNMKNLDVQAMSANGIKNANQKYYWQNDFLTLNTFIERFL